MSASLVYPLAMKLVMHYLAECADDSPTIADFKRDLRAALDDRFVLSTANTTFHPFMTATVMKRCMGVISMNC